MKIPLYVEMNGRRILVVGGGSVGARRALKFLEAGARVTVVSLEFHEKLVEEASSNPRLKLVRADASDEEILEKMIGGSDIVVVATDNPIINKHTVEIARRLGRLVNNATDAGNTDIIVPFEVEAYGLRVAVTSEGRSGIAARTAATRIKQMLEADRELRTLFTAMEKAKKYLKKRISKAKERIPVYFEIEADPEFKRHVARLDSESAWRRAKEIIDREALKHLRESS